MLNVTKYFKAVMILALCCWSLPGFTQGDAQQIITASCSGCHVATGEGHWTRISDQRKTPEGWQMTIARMQMVHKAQLIDPAGGDSKTSLRTLIKYFADNQGLAPSETEEYRYILEQELNTIEEHPTEEFRSMCARCHTRARVALQHRTEEEWRNLVHHHLGQFPTAEYSMMGRDRDWLGIALNNVVPYLAENYSFETEAWEQWSGTSRSSLEGQWRLVGTMPGKGDFRGTMVVSKKKADEYAVQMTGEFASGESFGGSGSAIVYTGYEWRASITIDGRSYRQVLAASANGTSMQGRMFDREQSEWGLRLNAVRDSGESRLLSVQPAYLQAGGENLLRIVGTNLDGEVNLGEGLEVVEVLSADAGEIHVKVVAQASTAIGVRAVSVGSDSLEQALTVYDKIGRISVEPAFAIARVGGDGGSQPKVQAMFDAVAWTDGADGKPGTPDDLRIGAVPAQWSVHPFDAQAEIDEDVRFAGQMDKDSGVFTPGKAGLNPQRKYQTNNAGNLKVLASVKQADAELQGDGHLIVTVQRWNNPPIR